MLSTFTRLRAPSQSHNLVTHPPPASSIHYSVELAALAARVVYKSPLPSQDDLPVYILDAAAFPDAKSIDYDALLPYVLARFPSEEELVGGHGYEIVFFAGGEISPEDDHPGNRKRKQKGKSKKNAAAQGVAEAEDGNAKSRKKSRPGWSWFLQAYSRLARPMRKRLMRLYVIHEKGWIRVLMEMFATVVSPKVRKKVIHVNTLSGLALHMPIEDLLIPPSAYLFDRRKSSSIFAPYATGSRAFGVRTPFPKTADGLFRLPRVLREATAFLLTDSLLDTDGIFRVSARAQTVEILKEAYDRGQKFIVWKDRGSVLTFPHYKEGTGNVTIGELDQIEGYGVHVASALIKLWYHGLREPIFPQSSYKALEKYHGDPTPTSPEQLQQMLSPAVVYSPLSETAGRILTDHLLPLLSLVAEHSENNRMTAQNLAAVFAPNMICGPDPVEDMKIVGIAQRLLVDMITNWKSNLAPKLGRTEEMFEESLKLPQEVKDREDPLEVSMQHSGEVGSRPSLLNGLEQVSGITLVDNENEEDTSSDDDEEDDTMIDETNPPTLPPRRTETQSSINFDEAAMTTSPVRRKPAPGHAESPQSPEAAVVSATNDTEGSPAEVGVRRKPAPAVASLPRYSTIVTNRPAVLAALEQYNRDANFGRGEASDVAQLHESHLTDDLPTYEQSTPIYGGPQPPMAGLIDVPPEQERTPASPEKIHRKPVGDGEGKE